MGMAATQARYLNLVARQSNLEYQGQQINQERSILSQQCTTLYNNLLAMEVPTPPSTQDFTSIRYTGTSGTISYNFDASAVKPTANGQYDITLTYTDYGPSLSQNNGYKTTAKGNAVVKTTSFPSLDGTYSPSGSTQGDFYMKSVDKAPEGEYYIKDNDGNYIPGGNEGTEYNNGYYLKTSDSKNGNAVKANAAKYSSSDLASVYIAEGDNKGKLANQVEGAVIDNGDGTYSLNTAYKYAQKDANGTGELTLDGTAGYTISGYAAYELAVGNNITPEQFDGYVNAIANSGLKKTDGKPYEAKDFYIYFDDENNVHFALKAEVERATDDMKNTCVTYDFTASGAITRNRNYVPCNVSFDPSSGRITSIDIPSTMSTDGKTPLSYTTIELEAETITDNAAYKDAYAQYEYKQYEYDKQQQEINAKTELIQQQDRNLELKLQRLDNERTQITTEIEALEKVINENIEKSYKTFSG